MKNRFSLLTFLAGCMILFSATFINHQWTRTGTSAILSWDAAGYYLYLPSLFYDDLGKLEKLPHIYETYSPTDNPYLAIKQPNGNYVMKYSSGMAVMYLPAFLACILLKITGYPTDGFSRPYQVAINFWGILVGLIGLWFIRKLLLKYFPDKIVAITLTVLILATNYSFYVSFCNVLAHIYLFTVYAMVLYFTDRWYEKPGYKYSVIIGLLCGLAALTRPTEIICVLIPLLWGIKGPSAFKERVLYLWSQYRFIFAFAVSAILVGSIQLIYWKTYSGHWLYYSYEDQGFSWFHPHFIEAMFSFKKGWFVYTPAMILAIIGFVPLYIYHRRLFWTTALFTAICLYITFAWDIWWYGGTFSMRAVIQYYAVMIFPLAAFLQWALRKPYIYPATAILLFFTWYNLTLFRQSLGDEGIIDSDDMTNAYFWRVFGRTHIDPDDKKLMDTNEAMPKQLEDAFSLIYTSNPLDTFTMDGSHQYAPKVSIPIIGKKGGWYRVKANVLLEQYEPSKWKWAQFSAGFEYQGKKVRGRMIKIQRVAWEVGKWQEIFFNIRAPEGKPVDTFIIDPWNANSSISVRFKDYRVYYTPRDK